MAVKLQADCTNLNNDTKKNMHIAEYDLDPLRDEIFPTTRWKNNSYAVPTQWQI